MKPKTFRTARAFKHGSIYTLRTQNIRIEYHYYRADRMMVRKMFGRLAHNPSVKIEHNVDPRRAMSQVTGGMLLIGKPSQGGFNL